MAELQREIQQEREKEHLQQIARDASGNMKDDDTKLEWMYKVSLLFRIF